MSDQIDVKLKRHGVQLKTLTLIRGMCPHWPIDDVPVNGLGLHEATWLQLRDAIQKIVRPDLNGQALDDCVAEWDIFKHDQVATLLNLRRKNGNLAYQFGREQTLDEVIEDMEEQLSEAGSW